MLMIARSAARLLETNPGSLMALADLHIILENLGVLARDTIAAEFPTEHHVDELEGRSNWWRPVSFLTGTGLFPGLNDLAVTLSELDRGRQPESLKPLLTGRGSGARTTHHELMVQRHVVEAADRVGELSFKDEERDAHLAQCGTSKRTVERYRESCLKGWPMFWPREEVCATMDLEEAKDTLRMFVQHAKLLADARPSKSVRAN